MMATISRQKQQISTTDHIDDIRRDDEKSKDESFVLNLLTKEVNQLSVKDRNDTQEEIHGVKCLAVEETPEVVGAALQDLKMEINKIPESQKQAYLRSLKIQLPSTSTAETTQESNTDNDGEGKDRNESKNRKPRLSYIHDKEFKLRFLRRYLFDVSKAAQGMMTYLDMMVELFGESALQKPISIADFTKEELRHMRKGIMQWLPYRDRSGRKILMLFPEEGEDLVPPFVKSKIAMYMVWAGGDKDLTAQRKGFVAIGWFGLSLPKASIPWKIKHHFYTINVDRVSAVHCCSPDTFHFKVLRSAFALRVGQENRLKIVFHKGEMMEIQYKLGSYGIPFEHIPVSWTGNLKVQYLKQWMRTRLAMEQNTLLEDDNSITDCPQLQDVVFRQGTSAVSHPGNVKFRSFIESIIIKEEHEKLQQISSSYKKKIKLKRPKQIALEIYEEHQQTNSNDGRFLIWNNQNGWWDKLDDSEKICSKIEYMVREFQKVSQKGSGTTRKKALLTTDVKTLDHVVLQSATSLFVSQDGRDGDMPFFSNKRQRLDGNGNAFRNSEMECFGIRWGSCLT